MAIQQYFDLQYAENALEAYYAHRNSGWPLSNKLRVYNEAKIAFDTSLGESSRAIAFEEVYDAVRAFSAFRNAAGPCWDASKAFEVISLDCSTFSQLGDHNLTNIDDSSSTLMLYFLKSLTGIKPLKRRYPMVPVSKLLHFYNPMLFPMYDEEFIWKRVCWGAFKQDYESFCRQQNYAEANEFTCRLNLQYTLWSANVIKCAEEGLMPLFADWFASKVRGCADPQCVLSDLSKYYSTAFEFLALGGAFLEGWM